MNRKSSNGRGTLTMIMIALFASITGVLSWVSVPLPFTPVPVNLAVLGVLLAGNILGTMGQKRAGAVSMVLYIALGSAGIPVFSGGSAGVGVLMGPTGGFIVGYLFAALFAGCCGWKYQQNLLKGTLYNGVAVLLCYLPGVLWFVVSTGSTVGAGLAACVLPFIPGDLLKAVAAALVSGRLAKVVQQQ